VAAHIYTQTMHRTTQITTKQHKYKLMWKSAGRAPSLQVLPWHNESQRDALFLIFIWYSTLYVSDKSTVHHQEYLHPDLASRQPTEL